MNSHETAMTREQVAQELCNWTNDDPSCVENYFDLADFILQRESALREENGRLVADIQRLQDGLDRAASPVYTKQLEAERDRLKALLEKVIADGERTVKDLQAITLHHGERADHEL